MPEWITIASAALPSCLSSILVLIDIFRGRQVRREAILRDGIDVTIIKLPSASNSTTGAAHIAISLTPRASEGDSEGDSDSSP